MWIGHPKIDTTTRPGFEHRKDPLEN